jgi:soluble lytic murein transglycosylase-like protein
LTTARHWGLRAAALLAIAILPAPAMAQKRVDADRYDPVFRKYSKRYFGVGYDWRVFKAQGLAESGLSPTARSRVGARGIMQLMPSTYQLIQSNVPGMKSIDDPEWNIAAGIMHDRDLWHRWNTHESFDDRRDFMFASYNAGEGPIMRAQRAAKVKQLDEKRWPSIELVAPEVPRWRYRETLGYVKNIRGFLGSLDDKGRVKPQ